MPATLTTLITENGSAAVFRDEATLAGAGTTMSARTGWLGRRRNRAVRLGGCSTENMLPRRAYDGHRNWWG